MSTVRTMYKNGKVSLDTCDIYSLTTLTTLYVCCVCPAGVLICWVCCICQAMFDVFTRFVMHAGFAVFSVYVFVCHVFMLAALHCFATVNTNSIKPVTCCNVVRWSSESMEELLSHLLLWMWDIPFVIAQVLMYLVTSRRECVTYFLIFVCMHHCTRRVYQVLSCIRTVIDKN